MANVKPLINDAGTIRPVHSGETVGLTQGGTGATSASAARTSLGIAIDSDVQAYSANLAAIAGVTSAADKLFYFTGSGDGAVITLSAFARSILDDADAATVRATIGAGTGTGSGDLTSANNLSDLANAGTALTNLGLSANGKSLVTAANYGAMRTALSLVPGTDVQAYHGNLTALAGLTLVSDRLPYANGSGTLALATFTAAGRALIDDADASAQRTTLGLGTSATVNTGTSGATIPLLNAANTHSGKLDLTGGGDLTPATTPSTTAIGYLGAPQNTQNGAYTTVMADAGKHLYHTSGSTHTWTIDSNANVAYPIGTILTFVNENGGGNVTIAITSDTLRWGSATGSRTLAANGLATALKVASTTWRLTGDGIT